MIPNDEDFLRRVQRHISQRANTILGKNQMGALYIETAGGTNHFTIKPKCVLLTKR